MKPKFYSKEAVAVLTILSPILGGILFSYNLKEIGKGKFSPYFIIGGILWILLTRALVAGIVTDPLSQLLFSGISGCLVMNFFIWDRFLGNYPDYEKKPIWKPTLIFTGICVALVLFQLLSTRK
jgi:MFS family permease